MCLVLLRCMLWLHYIHSVVTKPPPGGQSSVPNLHRKGKFVSNPPCTVPSNLVPLIPPSTHVLDTCLPRPSGLLVSNSWRSTFSSSPISEALSLALFLICKSEFFSIPNHGYAVVDVVLLEI